MPDRNGFGTSFEFFEEIARQPDPPAFATIEPDVAATLRQERCSLRRFGIEYWADMPLWSSVNGVVVTNFVTDNFLGKRGTVEVLSRVETIGRYMLADRQPPGSRTLAQPRATVSIEPHDSEAPSPLHAHLEFQSNELSGALIELAPHPMLMLIHPEFYCTS